MLGRLRSMSTCEYGKRIKDRSKQERGLALSYFILGASWLFIALIGAGASRVLGLIMAPIWLTNGVTHYLKYRRQIEEQ